METIAGFSTTGRRLTGPASDLVELTADNGLRHTAIIFHDEYRGHRALNDALEVVVRFLESPLVTGLSELVDRDGDHGAFVYPTGQCWSIAEVIRSLADLGESEGHVRAGLELMYATGQILSEATERGERDGIYSHGGLTPRRIMLKKDGQVEVIGYALPQVEILQFHEDDKRIPGVDSFRYCPPERIEFAPENLTSDLFGLCLIAFELMTGRPVYDGLVDDIRQQAARGETSRRLYRFRDKLPQPVCELLIRALRPDMADRFDSGDDFLEAVRRVLSSPEATGGSLMDLMTRVSSQGRRIGKALESGKTQMLSREQIQNMLDDDSDAPSERKSWSPSSRSSRRTAPRLVKPEEVAAAQTPEPAPPEPQPVAKPTEEAERPRWSRPSRQRTPPPPADVEETEPARAVRSSGDNAADLLARIRASSPDVSPEQATEREEKRRSAAGVIQSILGSSSKNSNFEKNATPETPPQPRFVPGRVRRVPRRRGLPESEGGEKASLISRSIEQSLANLTPPHRAEAQPELLPQPRIVGDAGAETGPQPLPPIPQPLPPIPQPLPPIPQTLPPIPQTLPPIPQTLPPIPQPLPPIPQSPPEKPTTAPEPVAKALPPKATPPKTISPPPVSKSAPKANATDKPSVKTARPAASASGVAAVVAPALPAQASGVPDQADFSAAASLDRAPDLISTASGRDGVASFNIMRGPVGRKLRMRLPLAAKVSEAIAWMLGNIVPVRTDLTGQISGWYRLSLGETTIDPAGIMGDLDTSKVYVLRFVPNQIRHADISVIGGPAPVRFVAPVGLAVPVVSLIDHLAAWLSLPAGDWVLTANGVPLSNYTILADVATADLLQLQLQPRVKA